MSRIYVAYTGGTIGMVKNNQGELEPKKNIFKKFLKTKNEIQATARKRNISMEVKEYDKLIDSSNVSPENWKEIVHDIAENYSFYDGFVIIHGTDTMAYTSSIVSYCLENVEKPVVITGAQKSVFEDETDGLNNIINALIVASGELGVKEVCMVFDKSIIKGARATKISALQDHAFTSPASKLLGTINENEIIVYPQRFSKRSGVFSVLRLDFTQKCQVVVIKLFPAFNSEILNFFAQGKDQIGGIVIEAYGQGNSPTNDHFGDAIKNLTSNDIVVVVTSQPLHGYVQFGSYQASSIFGKNGAISAYDMTTEAAVTKLYFLLNQNLNPEEIRKEFRKNYRGELNTKPNLPEIKLEHVESEKVQSISIQK